MFEEFTDRARQCVHLASRKAANLRHSEVGPEHLLFGFLKEGSGVGINVLNKMNVDLGDLKNWTEFRLAAKTKASEPLTNPPLSDSSEALLERLQRDIAEPLGHKYVETAHLLLALLEDRVCGEILRQNGVTADVFIAELIKLRDRATLPGADRT